MDPAQEPPPSSDHSARSSESEAANELAVESLVVGRAKRVTAGNRLSSLVEKEQDDEIELLFAENEQEEDESFDEEDDDASDVDLGASSSDDEDGDPAQTNDDLAGEKELQQQDRQEKRKRKAKDLAKLHGISRKKVKIDPTAIRAPATPPSRPKKKSERVSWLATAADAPTRISSRKQTVQNRAIVHQRLVDSEKQRIKVMRQMEEAQKRKDAKKQNSLTQAQRLEEAAKMEKKNFKSLNRWEESEKKRLAEQKAKLEALHNRQLTGPVLSFWSGLARWVDGKLDQLGVKQTKHPELDTSRPAPAQEMPPSVNPPRAEGASGVDTSARDQAQQAQVSNPDDPPSFLDGIHAYAAMPLPQAGAESARTLGGPVTPSSAPISGPPFQGSALASSTSQENEATVELTSRNLIALRNVDANAQRLPEFQGSVLMRKQKIKPQSKCLVASVQAILPANAGIRAIGRAMCNHRTAGEISRAEDGSGIRERVRVQGDRTIEPWRVTVE